MLWLYLTCYLVLLGAEINAEAEHQTAHDTTRASREPMGARDAKMADDAARVTRADEGRQRPDPKNGSRPEPLSARATSTNGGLTTSTACGRPRTSTSTSSPSADPGGGVEQRQRDAGPQGRRERAAGDLADRGRRRRRARPCPGAGCPGRSTRRPHSSRRGPAAFSASSASRPQNAGFFQPTAQPARACTGRDLQRQVLAVQRVAHLGAQRVAGAEAARADARGPARPPGRRPRARAARSAATSSS